MTLVGAVLPSACRSVHLPVFPSACLPVQLPVQLHPPPVCCKGQLLATFRVHSEPSCRQVVRRATLCLLLRTEKKAVDRKPLRFLVFRASYRK
jgi:hypothetical protein